MEGVKKTTKKDFKISKKFKYGIGEKIMKGEPQKQSSIDYSVSNTRSHINDLRLDKKRK